MRETPLPQANPYIVGRPVEGATLYGRDDVFDFVSNTLVASRQNAIVLYGQRRAGKTSILRELPHRLPAEQFQATFFDLQGQAKLSLVEVLHNLAVAIAESLKIPPPNQQNFKDNKDYFRKGFLPQVWHKLEQRRLLLLFDEFEVLSESEDEATQATANQEFYPYMRKLLDTEKRLAFIFVVGRRIDDLTHWVKRVFKEAQYKKIGLLQKAEAVDLITKPAEDRLSFQPEAIEAILELTSGHPFFTQLICFELFSYAANHRPGPISATDVAAIVGPALESGKPAFAWLWDAISTSGKIYLAAIAQLRAENKKANKSTIQEILNRFRIRPGADWSSVPLELADWDVVQENPADIQFVVKLVELWIRKFQTLRDIKVMLMHEGETEFKKARALAHRGQFELAVKAWRDLLTTTPNHLAAQLALAQTLLDQKKLKEAVDAFEGAFWLDEVIGREGLIDARLALAHALEEQAQFIEAAVHYRRVSELKADEYRLQEKLRILYDQGRKAAAVGDWTRAAHLFERITDIDRHYKDAHDRRDEAYRQAKAAVPLEDHQTIETIPGPSSTPRPRSAIPLVGSVIALALLGGSIGGWLIWGRGSIQATPTPTAQAIVLASGTPIATPTLETTVEPTPEPTTGLTAEPTLESTSPTQEPTGEPGPSITDAPSPTSSPLPSATPTATPTPPTPVIIEIVVTPTPSPTPVLPAYPQPQLISPPNLDLNAGTGIFNGRASQPHLEWAPVPGLGPHDFYTVSVSFPIPGGTIFEGATVKETFWDVDQRFYDEIAGPQRDFTWSVVVSHFADSTTNAQGAPQPVGEGVEVSPRSEERVFRWN